MNQELTIWKIGGKVINEPENLDQVLRAFAKISHSKILVHGGGNQATELCEKLGLPAKLVEGRRLTDAATLDVVTMVYAGLINKNLVAQLQAIGVNALGLTGADANSILARKRQAGGVDYGFAGDIADLREQSGNIIKLLLGAQLTAVFCALTHDGKGQLLNTNADTIASHLSQRLCGEFKVNLVYCFDKPGVLMDAGDPSTLIEKLTQERYGELKSARLILDGMIPKLDNAFTALKKGVKNIYLCHWKNCEMPQKGTKLCMK